MPASGSIQSPNHPSNYADDTTCTWVIDASGGCILTLSITSFHLEASGTCGFDYLTITHLKGPMK